MTPTASTSFQVLSCIKPSGRIHIGNYFGAIRNWVALQKQYRCLFGIVDLHAMTLPYDPQSLRRTTDEYYLDLWACGMDPQESILFVQSLIPEHIELAWVLSTLTPLGELKRQPQYKDYSQSGAAVSAGLFTYPILQAADILIYKAQWVPVGTDQAPHLELTRHIAQRFNHRFGEVFPIPEALHTSTPRIRSLVFPEKKMSKTLGDKHSIGLFEAPDSIRQKIRQAVTDSGETEGEMSPGVANLFDILEACGHTEEHAQLREDHEKGRLQYDHLKERVADALVELTEELRQRRRDLETDGSLVVDTIREMSDKARDVARETLFEVKECTGIKSPSFFY